MKKKSFDPWGILEEHYDACIQKKIDHADRVLHLCKKIAKKVEKRDPTLTVDQNLLRCAAILHDIAKFDGDKVHHKKAQKIIKKEYKRQTGHKPDTERCQQLGAVIHFHKGKKYKPPEDVFLEAAILRMADKIDKLYRKAAKGDAKGLKNAKKSYKDNLHFLRPMLGVDYDDFKKACDSVRKKTVKKAEEERKQLLRFLY